MKKQSLAILFSLFLVSVVQAQSFSGRYKLQSKEMISGIEYSNAIAKQITVIQTKDSIKIERITPAGEKDLTSTETLSLNRKPTVITTTSKRKKTATFNFDNTAKTATIIYTFSYPDKPSEIEFRNTEIWTIDSTGTLTIIKTSDATITDDWTIKAIFKKE